MLLLDRHLFPASLDEASDILRNSPGSVILGGCGYLRLGDRKIGTGIDLAFRHDIDRTILSVPIKFWRVRCSALLPGDAFVEGSDDTIYRAVFELVGSF